MQTVGNAFAAAAFYLLIKSFSVAVVDIDDSSPAVFGEKLFLGCVVVFHCFVIIEMILREVRKYRDIEDNRSDSVLFKRKRRNLHYNGVAAAVHHLVEDAEKLENTRSCRC